MAERIPRRYIPTRPEGNDSNTNWHFGRPNYYPPNLYERHFIGANLVQSITRAVPSCSELSLIDRNREDAARRDLIREAGGINIENLLPLVGSATLPLIEQVIQTARAWGYKKVDQPIQYTEFAQMITLAASGSELLKNARKSAERLSGASEITLLLHHIDQARKALTKIEQLHVSDPEDAISAALSCGREFEGDGYKVQRMNSGLRPHSETLHARFDGTRSFSPREFIIEYSTALHRDAIKAGSPRALVHLIQISMLSARIHLRTASELVALMRNAFEAGRTLWFISQPAQLASNCLQDVRYLLSKSNAWVKDAGLTQAGEVLTTAVATLETIKYRRTKFEEND